MNNKTYGYNQGFVQIVIILMLLVVILSLLGVSLGALFANPILLDNFGFIRSSVLWLWNNYLSIPFRYIYDIFVELIWEPSLATLRGIKDGKTNLSDVFKRE